MGYRIEDRRPSPEMLVPHVNLRNGGSTVIAFPCYYLEMEKPVDWHDHHVHDHIGWPYPGHPDHICQRVPGHATADPNIPFDYVDMDKAIPIMLKDEGYTDATVSIDSTDITGNVSSSMIMAESYIDPDDQWVVKVLFRALLEEVVGDALVFPFTVFAHADAGIVDGKAYPETYDEVARARLLVLPGNRSW
jgi:hypothetical protein